MVKRVLPFVLVALAVVVFAAAPVLAEAEKNANSHEGTVVNFDGKKLVMKDKDGNEHTHNVADGTLYTLDGKKSTVAAFKDLKSGTKIRVWIDKNDKNKVTKIDALDKNKDFGKGGSDK